MPNHRVASRDKPTDNLNIHVCCPSCVQRLFWLVMRAGSSHFQPWYRSHSSRNHWFHHRPYRGCKYTPGLLSCLPRLLPTHTRSSLSTNFAPPSPESKSGRSRGALSPYPHICTTSCPMCQNSFCLDIDIHFSIRAADITIAFPSWDHRHIKFVKLSVGGPCGRRLQ